MPQKEQKCAYCHAILFEDDDVVYCHECGAPHHRDCYNQLGECARKALHGQNFEADDADDAQPAYEAEPRPQGVPLDRDGHICKRCGKRSTSDTLFCPYCGTAFVEAGDRKPDFSGTNYTSTIPGFDPYGGVDPNSELDGHTVSEVASFVRVNTQHYIPIFKKLRDENRKTGWNWMGFLLTYVWLFFRKCYREGFVVLLFDLLATVMMTPLTLSLNNYIESNNLTSQQLMGNAPQTFEELYELLWGISSSPFAWVLFIIGTAITVLVHIAIGRYGNHLYRMRVSKRITQIKEDERYTDKASTIASAGGCNIFSAVGIFYGMNLISNIIMTFFM